MARHSSSRRKIKIVRVIARMNIGGPAIHVTLLNAGLDPTRYESVLVSGLENPGEGNLLGWAASKGVHPVMVPEMIGEATFKLRDVAALRKLYALLRREQPEVVHTHTAKAGFVGRVAAKFAGVPIIVHTYHGHVLRGYYGPLRTRLLAQMEKTLARFSDRIVAVSETLRQELASLGIAPIEKIVAIPLGLELGSFLNNQGLRGTFRQELGLSSDAKLVGIVGRIALIKNHRLFLEMARQIHSRVPASRFVIVGDGPRRCELEEYARQLEIEKVVIFTGWRRDLAKIYTDLDVLVVSSINEGTPVSAIEAMASGVPVVATRVGGLPDIVNADVTGELVTPGDSGALARAVEKILGDVPRSRRMGLEARKFAMEHFQVQRLVRDMESMYEELFGEKGVI